MSRRDRRTRAKRKVLFDVVRAVRPETPWAQLKPLAQQSWDALWKHGEGDVRLLAASVNKRNRHRHWVRAGRGAKIKETL